MHKQGAARAGEACICDWSPKAPGILECTADTAAVDMVEEEEAEEEWGIWQPAPQRRYALSGQFLQMDRGLCLCTLCWL